MSTVRDRHTATLLSNGKVLIAGGEDSNQTPLASAELYDSTAGKFTTTGSMTAKRQWHMATLLSNGKVLIVGGCGDGGNASSCVLEGSNLASAELYDPTAGTFTATGGMTTARGPITATLLSNGKVLIAGGSGDTSAELYDPTAGTFTATGSMTAARVAHTATLLSNGKVLIAGGFQPVSLMNNTSLASAELYDPTAGTFTTTGSMTTARERHSATVLSNGKVLIAGGEYYKSDGMQTGHLTSAELYDPAVGGFTPTGSMSTERYDFTATVLSNGKVLIAGGYNGNMVAQSLSAELYDSGTGKFTPTGNTLERGLGSVTATLLSNGNVLIAPGDSTSAELYE
jgi:WD40 repeat protein